MIVSECLVPEWKDCQLFSSDSCGTDRGSESDLWGDRDDGDGGGYFSEE
jgi:hypothetical protein